MRPLIFLLLALLWSVPAVAEPVVISATALPLNRDNPAQWRLGALRFEGALELASPDARFGGLSGLVVTADGAAITAVTDRGHWFHARLLRDANGQLAGIADTALRPLRDREGQAVSIRAQTHDAEAVVRDGDSLIVAFERRHRLWRYDTATLEEGRAVALPTPPGLSNAPVNGGIEALAVLAPGRYLAIAEELETPAGDLRAWLHVEGAWLDLAYAQDPGWKPTDIAVLPDGDLLAVERRFSRLGGFGARLRRIDGARVRPGAVLTGPVIAEFAPPLLTDNYEGLAIWRDDDRLIHLLLMSDDNFSPLQRTVLLQFRLEAD